MVGTEPRGQTLAGDGMVEHAAERWTIDGHGLHTKADDPADKLIYDNQVTPQQHRFGPELVHRGCLWYDPEARATKGRCQGVRAGSVRPEPDEPNPCRGRGQRPWPDRKSTRL